MNALLGIAQIAIRHKRNNIFKWCAIKRYRQYEAKWAKEKSHTANVTLSNFDEIGW